MSTTIPDTGKSFNEAPDFSSPAVVFKVGQPPKFYHINESILCASSEYFATALWSAWSQTRGRFVDLSDDNPELFNIYVNWLYGGKLFYKASGGGGIDAGINYYCLISLHALGEKLLDTDFKDAVKDAIGHVLTTAAVDGKGYVPHREQISLLYNTTTSDSALRRLVVGFFCALSDYLPDLLKEDHDPSFLRDVALRQGGYDIRTFQAAAAGCEFHDHAPGKENCYRTKKAWP